MLNGTRFLVAFVASMLLACAEHPQPAADRPNVLLIVVDTLRKDALSLYGNAQPVSPAIDALAARGWTFEDHHSHATQTVPSTLSLLLSRLPAEHGFSPENPKDFARYRPLYPQEFLFLAEVLRDAGYTTAGFTANPYLARENAFDQGHETFASFPNVGSGEPISAAAVGWLAEWGRDRARPFYLYLHYMDVHQPTVPPEQYRAQFAPTNGGVSLGGQSRPLPFADPRDLAYTRALYEAAVAHVDACIAEVLAELDALGVTDETLIVLTSDHGEEFGEHSGIGHGRTLYGEVVRVPLIMAYPPRLGAGRRIRHLSEHLDLSPTILSLAGVEVPETFRGSTVLEPAAQAFLEIGTWRGVAANGFKWLWDRDSGEQKLFSLDDELDRTPLDDPAVAAQLRKQLEPYLEIDGRRDPKAEAARVGQSWSEEENERLRALGYAQ